MKGMTNDEIRITREALMPKHEANLALLFATLVFSVAVSVAKAADWRLPPETEKLRPGRGVELATASCLLCHSADYISTQPRLARTAWKGTVEKMRLKYGAPIATNKVDEVVDYLTATYGAK